MNPPCTIHWFRQDLRLSDNPALTAAAKEGTVLPIYILDDSNAGDPAMGAASRWWLHRSLQALNDSLGGALLFYEGNPQEIFLEFLNRHSVEAIFWNRCYEPWRMHRDAQLKTRLKEAGIRVESYNSALLWEPWQIHKEDGSPYKVFTPFYRKGCLQAPVPRRPLPVPKRPQWVCDEKSLSLDSLKLLPQPRWDLKLEPHWHIGEEGAQRRFAQFIEEGLPNYGEGRDFPAKPCVSRLSPHLHFGEISPHQLWYEVRVWANKHVEHFCSELGWREFSYHLLYHHPHLPKKNLQAKFDGFPWRTDASALKAWQTGQTGVPMVDAGMRELWQTGYMHNRLRMIVGSFLVKNLRLHWHEGERWFWDTLVDVDLANNSAGWQWIAGCGADAAPYFRIFNPVIQGQKFDPQGSYVRQFVPEIAALPNKFLFNPWEAPPALLEEAHIELGTTYPRPCVDLKHSRQEALVAFQSLREMP